MNRPLRCSRCDRRYRGAGDWNLVFAKGAITGTLCPNCQTPAENAEAVINEATLDYGVNGLGLPVGRPKA